MKKSIYTVYDTVAQVFGHVVSEINDGSAIRAFQTSFQDNPNKCDYQLYRVADFLDHDGSVQAIVPEKIYSGFDMLNDDDEVPAHLRVQA